MKRDEIYLKHIIDAIDNIEAFIGKMDKNEFVKSKLVQSAVIRQLEIIGEAVKNVSSHLRKSYSDIPWKDIAGLRDKLIHEYFGVDVQLVWINNMYEGYSCTQRKYCKNYSRNRTEG